MSKPNPKPASEMNQDEINEFCTAASAVYFAVVRAHVKRTGEPAMLPDLLCPCGRVPTVDEYDETMLDEAERFLVRMGLIGER
ncbi:MAG: hypothetical protein AAFY46_16950 [Planctomycetota bacterium]